MKVKPIRTKAPDGRHISLTIGREYEVLSIEADAYRILSDADTKPCGNAPVLFEPECFEITDPTEPTFWACSVGADGERYCYPPEWEGFFFEDYHEGAEGIRKQFWEGLKCYYPLTWQERMVRKLS